MKIYRRWNEERIQPLSDLVVLQAMGQAGIFIRRALAVIAIAHPPAVERSRGVQFQHRARLRRVGELGEQHQPQHQSGEKYKRLSEEMSHTKNLPYAK